MENSYDEVYMLLAWKVSSASLPGGNLVDGLPPASSLGGRQSVFVVVFECAPGPAAPTLVSGFSNWFT